MDILHKLFEGFAVTCLYSAQRIDCAHGAPGYRENRKKICQAAGIDCRSLVFPEQQHGAKVSVAGHGDKGTLIRGCDGLITREKSLPLAVLTADCLPIFLYDPDNRCVGIGHAGWQGTRVGIAGELVRCMEKEFGSVSSNVHVAFGPSIRECCYEVGKEFVRYFPDSVIRKGKQYYFDLLGENKSQLAQRGVDTSKIFDSGICTSCSGNRFFSYRREGDRAGRTISILIGGGLVRGG